VMVYVEELLAYDETVEMTACEGEVMTYEGVEYPAGTQETFTHTSVNGCDSIIYLDVVALPLSSNVVELNTCDGTTVEYNDDDLSPGIYNYAFPNQFGCDSLVEVNVGMLESSYETVSLEGCDGSTVSFAGQDYEVGTETEIPFTNQQGCDSVINLLVTPLVVSISTLEFEICANDSINYNNEFLTAGTTTEYVFIDEQGCDSIVIVHIESYPEFEFQITATDLLCWNDASGEIIINSVVGGTEPFNYAFDDSNFQTDTMMQSANAGEHYIYVRDANGCVEERTIEIEAIPPLDLEFIAPDLNCVDDSVLIRTQLLAGETDSMQYNWQHGAIGNTSPIYNPGNYVLDVTNECETRAFELEVELGDRTGDGYFYIPNSFSPNGDGTNDEFMGYAAGDIEVLVYEMRLFDRWGNTMFKTTKIGEGWDGSFEQEDMNPGVYVWWMRAEVLVCGRRVEEVFEYGDVTIIR
ncbi:MAG: gliding motility-associated C-terminal domain-containing protein, partial [Saprospiraceae bacterium]